MVVILSLFATAQSSLEQKVQELRQDLSRPIVQWDDSFVVTTFQKYLNLYLDLLWEPDFHHKVAAYLPKKRPKIHIEVAGELRTPYIRKDEIVVPAEYLRYLAAIGALVGHDAYVEDHLIATQYPLLSGPYRTSAIIPLLQPLGVYLDVDGFMTLQTYLMCPQADARCGLVQNQATGAIFLFVILHELSHEVLHHAVSEEGVNLEHEIAADRNASVVLSLLAAEFKDFAPEINEELRFATEISPIVFLEVECSRAGSENTFLRARKEALLKTFPEDKQSDMELFIEPKRSSTNVDHMTVDWSDVPDLLLIDNVAVPIDEIAGREWIVTGEKHTLIALRSTSIAWAVSEPSTEGSAIHLHLIFKPFPPADRASIEDARAKRRWAEVLSRTTDGKLQPRDPTLTFYHFEALHKLSLDRYIKVQDWNVIPKEAWPKIEVWQHDAEPLSTWY